MLLQLQGPSKRRFREEGGGNGFPRHPRGPCRSLSALAAREVPVHGAALSLLQATDSEAGGRRSSAAVLKDRCAGEVPDEEKPHDHLCSQQGKDYPPPAKKLPEYVCTLPPLLPLPQNHYNGAPRPRLLSLDRCPFTISLTTNGKKIPEEKTKTNQNQNCFFLASSGNML